MIRNIFSDPQPDQPKNDSAYQQAYFQAHHRVDVSSAFVRYFTRSRWWWRAQKYGLNGLLVGFCAYLFFVRDIHITIPLGKSPLVVESQLPTRSGGNATQSAAAVYSAVPKKVAQNVNFVENTAVAPSKNVSKAPESANNFSNISVLYDAEATAKTRPDFKSKQEKCWDYVAHFVNVARAERQQFGIPISITLAQGLLESDAGDSKLTRNANNHFGIKTFNAAVRHVVMKDDTPTDKFKVYDTPQQSYRDHSLLLMKSHYARLQHLSRNDYKGWARGLQACGYATDPQYAEKLIRIIENLQLFRFDAA